MALTVDYTRTPYRITIPLSDLTFIVGVQYNLEVDTFWDLLADYSDGELGMLYPPLYRRIPATTSTPSITEIDENYYDFEFEEGLYSVNVINGNTNIRDVEVKNQVSVNTNNTTGFIDPKFLQFSTFEGGVWVQANSGYTGTFYPVGTPSQPVNNVMDAVAIAESRGFDSLNIKGTYVFLDTDVVDGYIIKGLSASKTTLVIPEATSLANCIFRECTVTGTLDGGNDASFCIIGDLTYLDGSLLDCFLAGTVTLTGTQANFLRCASGIAGGGADQTPVIDLGGSGTNLVIRDYHGGIKLINHTSGNDAVSIDMSSGRVILDPTILTGEYTIRGVGTVEDNTTNGATVFIQILDANIINRASYSNESVYLVSGSSNSGTVFPVGIPAKPVNNLVDAIAIARNEGLSKITITGFFVTAGTENLDGITIIGAGTADVFGITAGTSTVSSGFSELIVYGELNGLANIKNCVLGIVGLGGFTQCEGRIIECIINTPSGIIQRADGLGTLFDNCSFLGEGNPQIIVDANGKSFSTRHCTGSILVKNKTDVSEGQLHLSGATVELDASCTGGTFVVSGNGEVIDNTNGTVLVDNTIHGTQIQKILADTNELQLNQGSVDLTPVQAVVDAILIDTNELQLNQGDWATADTSGLSVNLTPVTDAIASLNDFNPATDTIARVTLVDTTTSNTDMRGTEDALLSTSYIAPDNVKIADMHGQLERSVFIDTEHLVNGNGYQQTPYNNWSDAIDYAENNNLYDLTIHADATVDRQLKNFVLKGLGNPTIDLNGQIVRSTTFKDMTITGSYVGSIYASGCFIENLDGLSGVFLDSLVTGIVTVGAEGSLIISKVSSAIATDSWTLDMNTVGVSTASVHNISGAMKIANMTNGLDHVHANFTQGTLLIDSTCTSGTIDVTGVVNVVDNSGFGCTVVISKPTMITELNNFNPATDVVATVNTVTNTLDMRGTDNALLASSYLAPDNASIASILIDTNELQINQGTIDLGPVQTVVDAILLDTNELQSNYFRPALDVVANVETVANTLDMRGTDNALIAANYVLPDNTSISSILTDTNELQLNQVDVNLTPLQVAVDFILQDTAAILVDTNELQSSQNAVDLVPLQTTVDAILQDTNELQLNQGIVDLSPIQNTLDAILIDTNQLQLNQGQWVTATGFVTNTTMTGLYNNLIAEHNSTQSAISGIVIPPSLDADGIHIALDSYANKDTFKADVSALPNDVNVISINGVVVTSIEEFRADTTGLLVDLAPVTNAIAALNDFNPVTDTVSRVALVDTTTANTDMRGTDNVIFDYTNIDDIHVSLNLDRNNPMSYTATQVSSADSSIIVNITENNTNDYTFTRA